MAFKKIIDYTPEELDLAVVTAVHYCKQHDLDFWKIFHGIDAYLERRYRKYQAELDVLTASRDLRAKLRESVELANAGGANLKKECDHMWKAVNDGGQGGVYRAWCVICGLTGES